jgi:hypothetical protein
MPVTVLEVEDLLAGLHLALYFAQRGIQVIGMDEKGVRVGRKFIQRPAQRLREGRVKPLKIAVAAGDAEHVQRERKKLIAVNRCEVSSFLRLSFAVMARHEGVPTLVPMSQPIPFIIFGRVTLDQLVAWLECAGRRRLPHVIITFAPDALEIGCQNRPRQNSGAPEGHRAIPLKPMRQPTSVKHSRGRESVRASRIWLGRE